MKHLLLTSLMLAGMLGLSTVAVSYAGPATAPATQPSTKPAIFNKMCPIMKHEIDPKGATYEYKGKTIGFCCEGCIEDFKADPEKYMKDLK